jgi:UPF0042 nucleotide-binding protein
MSVGLVVVVTGLSGAGKSTVLHALEDLGFYCVDNLPTPVIPETLAACEAGDVERVALGIDVRVQRFLDRAAEVVGDIERPGKRALDVVFLDASDTALLRRFSSTRRPHPLTRGAPADNRKPTAVLEGIQFERELLAPLRGRAKHVIDTTGLSVHELRRQVLSHYGPGASAQQGMATRVLSFGFKYGMPVDADLVLDVRFIDNPYFVEDLRALTGRDRPVKQYVLGREGVGEFRERVTSLLEFLLPRYEQAGKSYLTVAIGCTGGMHRSVALAEAFAEDLRENTRLRIEVVHRDIRRDTLQSRVSDAPAATEPEGGHQTS